MEEHTNREIVIIMKDGFSGIHSRLNKLNGSVKDNVGEISRLKDWKNMIVGGLIITNIILLPVALVLLSHWLKRGG